jgi:hypothetical protein
MGREVSAQRPDYRVLLDLPKPEIRSLARVAERAFPGDPQCRIEAADEPDRAGRDSQDRGSALGEGDRAADRALDAGGTKIWRGNQVHPSALTHLPYQPDPTAVLRAARSRRLAARQFI